MIKFITPPTKGQLKKQRDQTKLTPEQKEKVANQRLRHIYDRCH